MQIIRSENLPAVVPRALLNDRRVSAQAIALYAYLEIHGDLDESVLLARFGWSAGETHRYAEQLNAYGVEVGR